MKYNQIIEKNGEKRRIVGVCDEVFFISDSDDHNAVETYYTQKEIEEEGWKVVKEDWKPEEKGSYWYMDDWGDFLLGTWDNRRQDQFRLSIGNVHQTKEDGLEYKKSLIK